MYQSRHRNLGQGLLDLTRLYWNMRPFRVGRRRDRCPYRRLGLDLPSYDCMALIRAELSEALPLEGPSSDHQLPPG